VLTNRDLYDFVVGLEERARERPLAGYLRALWTLACERRDETALAPEEFASLLERAVGLPPPFGDPAVDDGAGAPGFDRWRQVVATQLDDLRRLELQGAIDDPDSGFGVDVAGLDGDRDPPARWYNLWTAGFLECAAAYAFGDAAGHEEIRPLAPIDWQGFADFLVAGQLYE
jgi:hypothetical protein